MFTFENISTSLSILVMSVHRHLSCHRNIWTVHLIGGAVSVYTVFPKMAEPLMESSGLLGSPIEHRLYIGKLTYYCGVCLWIVFCYI